MTGGPTYEELLDALVDVLDGAPHQHKGGSVYVDGNRIGICDHCGSAWPCPQFQASQLVHRAAH